MNKPPAERQAPSLYTKVTTKAWNKFADWSVEVFIVVIIAAGVGLFFVARAYIPIFR